MSHGDVHGTVRYLALNQSNLKLNKTNMSHGWFYGTTIYLALNQCNVKLNKMDFI